jgi:hypothetical protein
MAILDGNPPRPGSKSGDGGLIIKDSGGPGEVLVDEQARSPDICLRGEGDLWADIGERFERKREEDSL